MNKLINNFRAYNLLQKLPVMLILVAGAGAGAGLWILWLNNMGPEGRFGDLTWLFIALLAICGSLLIRKLVSALYLEPKRLKGHILNLPVNDRDELLSEYQNAAPENGRFFLSRIMLFFTYGGGIIRYSIVDKITVYPKGLWLETANRGVLLRTLRREDKEALANRLIDRTNSFRENQNQNQNKNEDEEEQ